MNDATFYSILSAVAAGMFTMMLTRVAAIAGARRASYALVAGKLVELWRDGSPKKNEIFAELAKLVTDGNRDLDALIESFVDAINTAASAADQKLAALLNKMRETGFLANVRESFVGSGPAKTYLYTKLLRK